MKETNFLDLSCRHCRYYQPEGRRGGSCDKLGVAVDSTWKACVLCSSPFERDLDKLDTTITTLNTAITALEEIVHLETALSLSYESYEQSKSQAEKQISKKRL